MNTKDGGIKFRQTMIARHGSEEAWKEWMRNKAAKGGRNGRGPGYGGGFSAGEAGRERARIYGSRGGRNSKRGKANKDVQTD